MPSHYVWDLCIVLPNRVWTYGSFTIFDRLGTGTISLLFPPPHEICPLETPYPALYHRNFKSSSCTRAGAQYRLVHQLNHALQGGRNMELTLSSSLPHSAADLNKRKRARQACDRCRSKKIRCTFPAIDFVVPTCCGCRYVIVRISWL